MPSARNYLLVFAVSVSVFGLFMVLALAVNPPTIHEGFFWRKPLVGIVFSLICISGILAALFPRQCSHGFHFRKESVNLTSSRIQIPSHHPNCEKFSAHVVQIGERRLCAACSGLLLGAIMALVGTVLYFFGGWHIGEFGISAVLIGVVWMVLGFFQLKFRSFVRLMLNVFFVLGGFLIMVGIDALVESLFVDLFLVALIVFWIFTRIELSRWDHWKICSNCESQCEVWEAKKNWG
jgi:hypothetical protein